MGRRKSELISGDFENEFVDDASRDLQRNLERFDKILIGRSANPLQIINPQPGYDYWWFARSVYNEEIPMEMALARQSFWEPVRASDMPDMANMANIDNTSTVGRNSSLIENGNLVLHKRHQEFGRRERLAAEMKKNQIMGALDCPAGVDAFGRPYVTNKRTSDTYERF